MTITGIERYIPLPERKAGITDQEIDDLTQRVQAFVQSKNLILNCPFDLPQRKKLEDLILSMREEVTDLDRCYTILSNESAVKLYWDSFCPAISKMLLGDDQIECIRNLPDKEEYTTHLVSHEMYLQNMREKEDGGKFYESRGMYTPESEIAKILFQTIPPYSWKSLWWGEEVNRLVTTVEDVAKDHSHQLEWKNRIIGHPYMKGMDRSSTACRRKWEMMKQNALLDQYGSGISDVFKYSDERKRSSSIDLTGVQKRRWKEANPGDSSRIYSDTTSEKEVVATLQGNGSGYDDPSLVDCDLISQLSQNMPWENNLWSMGLEDFEDLILLTSVENEDFKIPETRLSQASLEAWMKENGNLFEDEKALDNQDPLPKEIKDDDDSSGGISW